MIPWHLLVLTLVGWIESEQHKVIEYLREENRVLKGQLQDQRLRLTDGERRRLAGRGAPVPAENYVRVGIVELAGSRTVP